MGKVITIGREFGSNGRAIAQKLAKVLNIGFYDKEIIHLAAEKTNLSEEMVQKADESKANPWFYEIANYDIGRGYISVETVNDAAFRAESKVIKQIAEDEDCIIVGRCADYILREKTDSRHIFIYAPLNFRIHTVCKRDQLSERDAASVVKKMDKRRRQYYNYYTDRDWNDLRQYDMAFDASIFSVQEAVDLLAAVYRHL